MPLKGENEVVYDYEGGDEMSRKYRYKFYQKIYEKISDIRRDAKKVGEGIGVGDLRNEIGLYTGSSSCPGPMAKSAIEAIVEANKTPIMPLRNVEDQLRDLVKDLFGDDFDGASVCTCEAALRVCFEILFSPPTMRKGDSYRARYIVPYEEDFDFTGFYGRPFPPKYKNLITDRSASAGELGIEGKSISNLESILIKLYGARYEVHGIKYNTVPLLTRTDSQKSYERIVEKANMHSHLLSGFATIGYDTPGYGYSEKDEKGVPTLKKLIGNFAVELDLPYLIDCASGVPSFGYKLEDVNADVMMWSMDKMVHAPTSGLIVGKEEAMVPIRKGLGLGGQRYGEVSSHSKGVFSCFDPGRDALIGQISILETLRDEPNKIKRPIDDMHRLIEKEFNSSTLDPFKDDLIITKSYTMGGIEVNYSETWHEDNFGIPIFTSEDLFANTNPIMIATEEMGIYPPLIYSGNIFLGPGLGNLDEDGELIKEDTSIALRGLVKSIELVCKHADLI